MATYAQPGGKRQKVKEGRAADSVDYFQGIDKVEYNNAASSTDTLTYRYYNATERMHSKTMEDWLKYSLSLTDFRKCGEDNAKISNNRPWDDNTHSMDNYKRCIKAFFDFCTKLGVKYWTAFDTDLLHLSDNWDENKTNWDEIVEYLVDLGQRYHLKLLWLAPDLHSHPRYANGACTNNDVNTFTLAAAQIKKCLEVSQRLNAECFLIWPHREGYDVIYQSDVARELKLFVKLLKIVAEYKDRLNTKIQLLIMPYRYDGIKKRCEDERLHYYMWDVTSCLFFLKNYGLDRHYKVCSPPGHHMYLANAYNMLGGVMIGNDFDLSNIKSLTLMMKSILDQNHVPSGGVSLRVRSRAGPGEAAVRAARALDCGARALRLAVSLAAEQIFAKHVQQRYIGYYSGFGSRLITADVTLDECEEYYKKNQAHEVNNSKVEHFDFVFQRHLDSCEHI